MNLWSLQMLTLTLSVLWANSADKIYFSYFSQKIGFTVSCHRRQFTWNVKSYFLGQIKNISKCGLLNNLPSMWSLKQDWWKEWLKMINLISFFFVLGVEWIVDLFKPTRCSCFHFPLVNVFPTCFTMAGHLQWLFLTVHHQYVIQELDFVFCKRKKKKKRQVAHISVNIQIKVSTTKLWTKSFI